MPGWGRCDRPDLCLFGPLVCYRPISGGFCTMESNKQNTTKTASPAATIMSRPSSDISALQSKCRSVRSGNIFGSVPIPAAYRPRSLPRRRREKSSGPPGGAPGGRTPTERRRVPATQQALWKPV